jgi:hypothetical protein
MFRYIFAAVVLVCMICLVYWVVIRRVSRRMTPDEANREDARRHINMSAGTFDQHARKGLDAMNRIQHPKAADYFQRASLIRYHVGGNNDTRAAVVRDYANTIRRLDAADEDTIHMIHDIGDFVDTRMGLDMLIADADYQDDHIVHMIRALAADTAAATPAIAGGAAAARVDKYSDDTRAGTIVAAMTDAAKMPSNAQNVHDSCVNGDLREILRRLQADQPQVHPRESITRAREYIERTGSNPAALRTLNHFARGDKISTFGENEDVIFAHVWDRCDHPRNTARRQLMQDAVVAALADAVEGGTDVCANGRCARVLNSLVTLDHDPAVSETGVMTLGAYRLQIINELRDIIENCIDAAKKSTDPVIRAVGEAYDTGDDSPYPEADSQFKANMRTCIDRHVDTYSHKLSERDRSILKAETYIYATV